MFFWYSPLSEINRWPAFNTTSPRSITFKFFKLCLHAEDEADEHIKSGNKAEWHSARMIDVFAGNEE